MITANVPSAKKIIVHGPDSSSGTNNYVERCYWHSFLFVIMLEFLVFFACVDNSDSIYGSVWKKLLVLGGIPSQFPIHEDTQFQQILTDSLEFFNIPDEELDQYFLVDSKTGLIHNPGSYVR